MRPLAPAEIRASFVNCSQGEARKLSLPAGLDNVRWDELEFLGWVDPRAVNNAYLVLPRADRVVGLSLRAAPPPRSRLKSTMCGLCVTTHAAADVALFSARRAGAAGRDGNTLGIYACGDLGCCQYVRARRKPSVPQPAETITTDERIARLQHKVTRFVDQVLAITTPS
ncbi:MAG TPA: FBP domain-containing protein [Pseudonocardiaceae bacterium]